MSILSDLLVGQAQKTSQHGTQSQWQQTGANPREQQLMDLLNRSMIGQMVNPPNTAISTPMQQAVSSYQGMMPTLQQSASGSLASRLSQPSGSTASSGSGTPGTAGSGVGTQDWTTAAGANQAGLQTREQLGLPDRKSYFTFMPSAQQVADIGLSPVRPGGDKATQQAYRQQQQQRTRAAVQAARQAIPKGPGAGKARKAAATQARLDAAKGPSYL